MTSVAKMAAVAQLVAENRLLGGAQSTGIRQPWQVTSVGVGEARPLGFGKCSAASVSESEHAESFDEASSSGEEALHWIAEYNVQDLVETVKNGGKGQHLPRKDCRMEWRPPSTF